MKIYLIGDSTLQYNDETTYPQVGWGQYFIKFIKDNIEIINLAKNGSSTKSFIDENRFDVVKKNIKKGDLLIIQFGHNDEKKEKKERYADAYGDYQKNLNYFINTARKFEATPILLSSIPRRTFVNNKLVNSHGDYPKAMESLANKLNVLYIDLNKILMDKLDKEGDINTKKYYMNFSPNIYKNYINGLSDNTHLREEGALLVSKTIVKELKPYFDIFKS